MPDRHTVGVEGDVVVVYRTGKRLAEGAVDGFYVRFGKGLVSESVVGIYVQGFLLMVDVETVEPARAYIGIPGLIIRKEVFQPFFHVLFEALRRCVEGEEAKQEYEVEAFHDVFLLNTETQRHKVFSQSRWITNPA